MRRMIATASAATAMAAVPVPASRAASWTQWNPDDSRCITVNALAPGYFETALTNALRRNTEFVERLKGRNPPRLGKA